VPTALVTGASRGIGRAIALALAADGYDVAVTARTVNEGDASAIAPESGTMLPGSLASTSAAIEALGRVAVAIPMDLLEAAGLAPAVDAAIAGLGHLDVLVNNAIYVGAGNDRLLLDTEPDNIERRVYANITAQLLITQRVLRHMVQRGHGTIIDITSGAGQATPRQPVGRGGWPVTYAVTKAGFHRIADMVAVEYGPAGIRAINVNPGFVATERVLAAESLAFVAAQGIEPRVVGEVVAWLLGDGQDHVANGGYVHALEVAKQLGLA
jgi:NAD(P)-dependent dehydrogenase (short-subunit alcohol dehydrogenase family)